MILPRGIGYTDKRDLPPKHIFRYEKLPCHAITAEALNATDHYPEDIPIMLETLTKLWEVLPQFQRRKLPWMLALVVLMTAAETLGVVSIMPFLSVLGRPEIIEETDWLRALYETFSFTSTQDFTIALGLTSIVIVISSSAVKTITVHILNRFVHFTRHSLSSKLLSTYIHQPYDFFLNHNPSALAKNILSETDQLILGLLQPLSRMFAHGLVLLAMTIIIFVYDPLIATCVVGALALLYGSIYALARKRLMYIGQERRTSNSLRYQACTEAIGGIKAVKITNSSETYMKRFDLSSREYSRHMAANDTLNQTPLYLVEAVGYTGLIIIALSILTRSNDVAQVLPALGLYGFAAYRMLPAAQIIYRGFAQMRASASALNAIHHDMNLPRRETVDEGEATPIYLERGIQLHGILYAYPSNTENPVFDGLNLFIPCNTTVGVVGKSGTGKSTLMDILLGLLHPQAGTITVDGQPITHQNIREWHRSIGYVPQHIYLTDASIAENIAFGVPAELIDLVMVERAARAAQLHDFIVNELPFGYETKVGDRGVRLSGGQCQRIGIARALYRDPPILLLDEATSALDSRTEESVNLAIKNLSGQKTIIIISHRKSSLNSCSLVYSIEDIRRDTE